jgi:hypothetical protein
MKELCHRVNLVPVIAKADTMTLSEMAEFKRRVRETMAVHGITLYSPELESEDEDTTARNKSIMVGRSLREACSPLLSPLPPLIFPLPNAHTITPTRTRTRAHAHTHPPGSLPLCRHRLRHRRAGGWQEGPGPRLHLGHIPGGE